MRYVYFTVNWSGSTNSWGTELNLISVSNESARQIVYQVKNCALVMITCPQHSIYKHLSVTQTYWLTQEVSHSQSNWSGSHYPSGILVWCWKCLEEGLGPCTQVSLSKKKNQPKKGKKICTAWRTIYHLNLFAQKCEWNHTKASWFEQGKLQMKGSIFYCLPVIHYIIA